MMQVDSVWAPGETRPMCINGSCREGSGPLPYLRLTVKAMVHLGAGVVGPAPWPRTPPHACGDGAGEVVSDGGSDRL